MQLFVLVKIGIGLLREILGQEKKQTAALKVQTAAVLAQTAAVQAQTVATQAQTVLLQEIRDALVPPPPGPAVSLAFVFGGLNSL